MEKASTLEWRCACCGYHSARSSFFRFERVGCVPWTRPVCGGCKPYTPTKREAAAYMNSLAIIFIGGAMIASDWRGAEMMAYLFLFSGSLVLSGIITVAVHEAGHAIAAALVGKQVTRVVLGSGPILATRRWNGIRLELRAFLPVRGETYAYDRSEHPAKWREAVASLGGVAANLVFAVGGMALFALLFASHRRVDSVVIAVGYGVIASQILAIGGNLLPLRFRVGGARLPSDGRYVFELMRAKDFRTAAIVTRLWLEGASLLETNRNEDAVRHFERAASAYPGHLAFFALQVHAAGKARGPRDAARRYLEHRDALQAAEPGNGHAAAWAYANVAWHAAAARDLELLPLADDLSKRAVEMAPDAPYARAARGAALVALGQRDAGIELLTDALRDMEDADDKRDVACALADAERAGGYGDLAAEIAAYADHLLARSARTRS